MDQMNENTSPNPEPNTHSDESACQESQPITQDDKILSMLAHLLGLLTSFLGPLILWLAKKNESPLLDDQAKESMNFQLTILLCFAVASLLRSMYIGYWLIPVVAVVNLVFCILACMDAYKGKQYRYPICIHMIK